MENIIGQRFGRLVVLSESKSDGRKAVFCKCDCGTEKVIKLYSLIRKSNSTKSCGCLERDQHKIGKNFKHGYASHGKFRPTWLSWKNMKVRCDNPRSMSYQNYGGRGITYDPRWRDFQEFLKDMGECPEGMTIERIDNDGNYYKENCRWATRKDQGRNRRNNIYLEHQGKRMLMKDWAEELGISYKNLWKRVFVRKMPIERALSNDKYINQYR